MITFSTQEEADQALVMVNEAYGCPYTSEEYFMDTWDAVKPIGKRFGFTVPEDRCGKIAKEVISVIQRIFTKIEYTNIEKELAIKLGAQP